MAGDDLWQGGEAAIGNGWLARGERLLDRVEEDVVERGYLLERATIGYVAKGEFAEAVATAPSVTEYGRRFGDTDLTSMGLHMEGRLTIFSGRAADGLRLLDEAIVSVLAGEVSPIFSGVIYCSSVEACQQISDFGRMGEWTHALTTWCDSQPDLVAFTGQCAVHRGQLMRLHGAYRDAISELEHAAGRYAAAGGDPAVGQAHYERGDAQRIRGEYEAAEAAYAVAAEYGHPTQPGRALLWLARGRPDAASAAVHRVVAEVLDPVHRSQVLPAAVDVLVQVGRSRTPHPWPTSSASSDRPSADRAQSGRRLRQSIGRRRSFRGRGGAPVGPGCCRRLGPVVRAVRGGPVSRADWTGAPTPRRRGVGGGPSGAGTEGVSRVSVPHRPSTMLPYSWGMPGRPAA